jgi:hypothetical protein
MKERITARLPKKLLDRARRRAADDGLTLEALTEEGLRLVIGDERQRPKPPDPMPVSKAVGGTWPGVDLSNSAAIQEMEDLEYIERMKAFR